MYGSSQVGSFLKIGTGGWVLDNPHKSGNVKEQREHYTGFDVLTLLVMKISIFFDIMFCSLMNVNQCLRILGEDIYQKDYACRVIY
jgi:hypothetical protein